MREENTSYRLSEDKRYKLSVINRLAIGLVVVMWSSLLMLKQVGIIEKNVSTLPFILIAFGMLLVFGGVYRLTAREKAVHAEPHFKA